MTQPTTLPEAGYAFIPGVFQYSGGVGALDGYAIHRVRFAEPLPLDAGFLAIAEHLHERDRPLTALCGCELRSPAQFSEADFTAFNRLYVGVLETWGIVRHDTNPVARSNVCPEIGAPSVPCLHAFAFTVPVDAPSRTFLIAGSGEAPEGQGNYFDHVVRRGDQSAEGLREKARFVLAEMEARMAWFGAGWPDITATQVYTVYDLFPFLADELVARGATRHGLDWHYCRPPILHLDYEMDCRRVLAEGVLAT